MNAHMIGFEYILVYGMQLLLLLLTHEWIKVDPFAKHASAGASLA